MRAQSDSAQALATDERSSPRSARVGFPGLQSAPASCSSREAQSQPGAVGYPFEVKCEVRAGKRSAERLGVIDSVSMMSITANLGDTPATITHPATTTHGRIAEPIGSALESTSP